MKKIITCLAVLFCFSGALQAQYYFNSFPAAGTNPGGLNADLEYPNGGGLTTGWAPILGPSAATPVWSANQTVPFAFNFNGNPATQFKVSSTGVLTFTTSAATAPALPTAGLPSANIPDNSVCVWGIQTSGTNDFVLTKTFGTAPNRQHWIFFSSHALGGSGWSYWSIVLEETSDNIYIVDQRHSGTNGGVSMGIQIDATTAASIGANVMPMAGTDPSSADNTYYEFIQGSRPSEEIELSSLDVGELVLTGGQNMLTGTITNKGSNPLTSYSLSWTVDGGVTTNTQVINTNVAPNASASFSHPIAWTPARGDYNLQVYSSLPNGLPDGNPLNDTISRAVSARNFVTRKVLLEEFTTAPCQFCPDGAVVVEQILAADPNVIGVGEHACFGTDAMTIPEASTYCSAFGSGAPTACIDRVLFPGQTNVAHSRTLWQAHSDERSALGAFVDVNVTGTYNNATRQVSANVDAMVVDSIDSGDLRVSLFVVEDHVTGTGNGYNQVNAYNNVAGHPYFGAGNPIVGFDHRHVLRDVYPASDPWGDNTVIPTTPQLNTNYGTNYTFNLNAAWKDSDTYLVAFVSYFNANTAQREVLNAFQVKLDNLTTGIEDIQSDVKSLEVYPNPSTALTNVKLNLNNSNRVELSIFDITGKEIVYHNYGTMPQGEQTMQIDVSALPSGFYFINMKVGNELVTKKISVINE